MTFISPTHTTTLYTLGQPTDNNGRTEVAFVLDNVADWQTLAQGVRPGVEVVVLDSQGNGLEQMAGYLAQKTSGSVDAIHLLGHGSSGAINLGGLLLNNSNLSQYSDTLAHIGQALTEDGDFLVYGCNVAEGQAGMEFVGKLAQASGADVAASDDLTGASGLDGDWSLEYTNFNIESSNALSVIGQREYGELLSATTFNFGNETITGDGTKSFTIKNTTSNYTLKFTTADIAENPWAIFQAKNDIQTDYNTPYSGKYLIYSNGGAGMTVTVTADMDNNGIFGDAFKLNSFKLSDPSYYGGNYKINPNGGTPNQQIIIVDSLPENISTFTPATPLNFDGITSFSIKFSDAASGIIVDDLIIDTPTPSSPTLTSATYNASSNLLTVTGTGMTTGDNIDPTKLTITGEGNNTYTLTSGAVTATSATEFSITLNAADQINVEGLLDKNGTAAATSGTFNLAGATNWDTTAMAAADLTGNGVTVSNVQQPTITSATYDAGTGVLVVTGTNLVKQPGTTNDIDVTKLSFTGQGGSASLTANTANVEVTSATSFTVTLGSTDKTSVNAKLNANGLASSGSVTYNLAAADDWNGPITPASSADISDSTDNAITVSGNNAAPTLGGTFTTAGTVNDNATTTPFSGVTYTDADGTSYTATITYTAANGSLSGTGLTGSAGSYTVTGADAATVQANLRALVFTPTANQVAPASTVQTTFTLTPNDGSNGTANATTVVTATSVNDAPTNAALSTSSVAENTSTASALTVGALSSTDPDTGDTFTYSIVGGTDQADFQISGGNLQFKAGTVLNFEAKSSYAVTVRSTDAGGLTFDKPLTVTLNDVNEAPTVANATVNQSASATQAFSYAFAANTFADVDAGQTLTYTATQSDNSALPTWLTFTPGTRTFSGTPALGDIGTVSVKVIATDNGTGSLSVNDTFDLVVAAGPGVSNIVRAGSAAALTNASTVSYTVTFNESVTGVDTADFALTGAGTAAGTIASVTGSGTTYTVTVNTVSGDGTLRLDLNNSGTGIVNGASTAITSGFTAGQSYTLDHTAPTVTIGTIALSADTGTSSSDLITKTASQTITTTLSGAPAGTDIVWGSVDDGVNWIDITSKVTGTALSWDGATLLGSSTLKLKVTDAAGNDGSVASQAYVLDTTAPTLSSSTPTDDATAVAVGGDIVLTFSEAIVGMNGGQISLRKGSGEESTVVESFIYDTTTSTFVNAKETGGGTLSISGATLTINPANDLDAGSYYYVRITAGTLTDAAGNEFAGLLDNAGLNFSTATPDTGGGGGGGGGGGSTGSDDQDGVDASVEDSAPGLQPTNGGPAVAGDGNGDGIKDSDQAAVSSLTFLKTDTSVSNPGNAPKVFVTLVADAKDGHVNPGSKAVITSIAQKDAPANLPEGAKLPLGLFDFTAKAAAPGSTENFSIFIDGDITINGYWKEVHSGASAGTWVNLADAAYGGKIVTEQGKTRLDFSIQDGGIFDDDGKADGTISDPGGPGFMVMATTAPSCPFDPFRVDADKDGMTDAVELLRGSSSAMKNNDVFSHNDLFVDQLYRDFFGREGYGDAGSAYWLNAMSTGVMNRADVLTSVLSSPEFDSHAGVVIRLYHATLGRSPELCGYNYWLGQANAGMNTSQMGQAFLDSSEFATKQAGLDNAGFVDLMYHNVLQRAPEAAGRAYWIDQLQTGKTDRGGMLYSVVQSQEFKAAMVDDVAVDILYLGLLDRTASSAETAYWMSQYSQYANPSAFLQAASATTTEYHDRFVPNDGSTHSAALVGVLDEQAAG